jgi:hypothetical protein
MTNLDLLALDKALNSLDTFKFDGVTTWKLAKNLRKVRTAAGDLKTAQQKLIAKHANGSKQLAQDSDEGRAYLEEWGALLDGTTEFEPHKLKLAELRVGDGTDKVTTPDGQRVDSCPTNAIPAGVLAALEPIIEE